MIWFRRQSVMAKGAIACVGFLFLCALVDRLVALGYWLAGG